MPENRLAFPAPDTPFPMALPDGAPLLQTAFLKAVIDHPRIEVGEYSYAHRFDPPGNWAASIAPFLHEQSAERLEIGKFCQIADGAIVITSSANHRYDGVSSFPFAIFGDPDPARPSLPGPGPDTVIGNDVWIGQGAKILPGARLGHGVIVGAGAVIGGNVPPYSIVAGNPGRVLRRRFDERSIDRILKVAWWDWPIERILAAEQAICGGDVDALERAAT
jgi:virginiamycin A acetyltransferase